MAYQSPQIIDTIGRTIKIAHLELPGQPETYLTAAVAASATSLTVADNSGYADDDSYVVGSIGEKGTEIKKIDAAVSRGTALTSTALSFAHPNGTKVQRVLFDQFKVYGNTTDTTTGATLIATIDMQVDAPYTTYVNEGTEYNYYFVRTYNSVGTLDGAYSDGVASSGGYPELSVGKLIEKAGRHERITDSWFFSEITDGLRYITGKLKRWSSLQSFDASLGSAVRGLYSVSVPSDIEEPNQNKSFLDVRINGRSLRWQDKKEFNGRMNEARRTQVRTAAAAADTTLKLDNSYDFRDSGSVNVYVSGTKYTITYTGVTRSTTAGVLTGVPASGDGSISVTIPVDTNVWQDESEGQPEYYTVYDGNVYFWPMPDASNDYMNVTADYYTRRTAVDSYGDILDERRYDCLKHWLKWKKRAELRGDEKLDLQDGDYVMFRDILNDLIRTELGSQKHKMKPVVNRMN